MPRNTPPPTTIEVNGFALRQIRVLSNRQTAELADQVDALVREAGNSKGMTRSYLAKIELGHSTRVSPRVYAALLQALNIEDRRVLLASPHRPEALQVAS